MFSAAVMRTTCLIVCLLRLAAVSGQAAPKSDLWSLQPVVRPSVPAVKNGAWAETEIDRFLLARLEQGGLHPVEDAAPRDLLRRVKSDLTGLPPTPDEADAFEAAVKSTSLSAALAVVVDRYLDSPRFGERWGRHWLDVARYGESTGKGINILFPQAWRYRDYVVDSFNSGKPVDQFFREQIAGDLLPANDDADRAAKVVATGFLAIGTKSVAERDRLQFLLDLADEQIDALGQGMLGLTVSCARCHDHKTDPIPQKDYYALAGIFRSTETCYGTLAVVGNTQPSRLLDLPAGEVVPTSASGRRDETPEQMRARLTDLRDQQRADFVRSRSGEDGKGNGQDQLRAAIFRRSQIATLEARLESMDEFGRPRPQAMGVADRANPIDSPLFERGDPAKPGAVVPRGTLSALPAAAAMPGKSSGRLELADWVTSPQNPLTSRVFVNRVWHWIFGQGLVTSVDNFGTTGARPSHPELLDFLASRFVDGGWDLKKTVREIVLSHAYRLAVTHDETDFAADPDNTLVWRMSSRRLDAESLRDALLSVSGQLNFDRPTGSLAAATGDGFAGQAVIRPGVDPALNHRSLYLPAIRDQLPESMDVFDAPGGSLCTGARESTTTATQALYLLNSAALQSAADALAHRVSSATSVPDDQIALAWRFACNRPATAAELASARLFLDDFPAGTPEKSRATSRPAALSAFCQALLASAEFTQLR